MPSGPEASLNTDADGDGLLLEMSDPASNSQIVGGMAPGTTGSEWRFTRAHPRFRLQLRTAGPFTFYIRFFLHEQSLPVRGPITLNVTVNGHSFQTYRFTQAGDTEYRKPMPESWIVAPGPVDFAMDVDPPWRLPDGTIWGVLLHSIGFEKRHN